MTKDPKQLTVALLDELRADVTDAHEYVAVLQAVQQAVIERSNETIQASQADRDSKAASLILAERAQKRGISIDALAAELGITAKALTDNGAKYINAVKLPDPALAEPK